MIDIIRNRINTVFAHQGFKKYFANTSWLFAEKILRMTVGLFVGVWVARYLGPAKYGLLSYARSFVGLFTAISTLGLDGIVVRELVKDESRRDVLLGTAFVLKLIGAIFVLIFLGIAVNFTSNDKFTNLLIFIIASATIFQSFNVIDFYFQSKVLSKYVVFANMISLLISSLLKIYFILTNKPLIYFALVVAFDSLVLAIGFIYFYSKQKLSLLRWKFNKKEAIRLLKDSWPLLFVTFSSLMYANIDQVMIKGMLGDKKVGVYSAAVKIAKFFVVASPVFAYSFFPAILNAKKRSLKFFHNRIVSLYSFVFWISLTGGILLCIFSNYFVDFLYGRSFSKSASVLSIYIFTSVFAYVGGISSRWYIAENLQILFSFYLVLSAILNVVLNLIFIPMYGIKGAAIASVISYSFSVYFSNLCSKKTIINFKLQTLAFFKPFSILLFR